MAQGGASAVLEVVQSGLGGIGVLGVGEMVMSR